MTRKPAIKIADANVNILPGGAGESVLFVPAVVIGVFALTYPTPAY